jgi:hypothetical protein
MRSRCLAAAAVVSATLTACVPPPPGIEEVPLSRASRESLQDYFAIPERPKAFAFAPATGASWHAWGYRSAEQARDVALRKCEEFGSPCEIYAINDVVVWGR